MLNQMWRGRDVEVLYEIYPGWRGLRMMQVETISKQLDKRE